MTDFDPSRRAAIKQAARTGGGALAASYLLGLGGAADALARAKTPAQPEGPFYPVQNQVDKDADMTRVAGRSEAALGQRVRLSGKVVDVTSGAPIAGALVEFWQACESGKYNHPNDPNDAPLDPNFQYWAQVRTDANGAFGLLTIKPGAYPADNTWTRPPHIHVKVHQPGYPALTTQIYFAGDSLNDDDQILRQLTAEQRALVTVDFTSNGTSEIPEGQWTIYLARFDAARRADARAQQPLTTPELD